MQLNNLKSITTAVILAGGKGTRLKEVVSNVPKPMAPINNRPFLEYLMDYWIQQGVSRFILSVGYMQDSIINYFGQDYKSASIEYAKEDTPLGTGGGLLNAAKDLTETFLLLNGDTFLEVDIKRFYKFHLKRKAEWTFALFHSSQFERYMGLDVKTNGQIESMLHQENNLSNLANGGVYLVNPRVLKKLTWRHGNNISLEDELIPDLFAIGSSVFGIECKGKFIDIGLPTDYYKAKDILFNRC